LSLLLDELRLRVFENKTINRTFGLKEEEVTTKQRILNSECFYILFYIKQNITVYTSKTMWRVVRAVHSRSEKCIQIYKWKT